MGPIGTMQTKLVAFKERVTIVLLFKLCSISLATLTKIVVVAHYVTFSSSQIAYLIGLASWKFHKGKSPTTTYSNIMTPVVSLLN